jgi:hypothetical protein
MASAVGVGANGLGYAWSEVKLYGGQLGSGPVFEPLIASIADQQSALGEL